MEISGSRNLNPPGFNWRSAFVCFSVEFFAFFMPSWDPPKITMDGDPIVGMTWITLTWKKTCLAILRVHVTRTHSRVSENVTNPTFGDQIKRSRRLNHLVLPVHFLGHNIKQKSWVLPPLRGWKQKLFKPPFGAPKSKLAPVLTRNETALLGVFAWFSCFFAAGYVVSQNLRVEEPLQDTSPTACLVLFLPSYPSHHYWDYTLED